MRINAEELQLAQAYDSVRAFDGLSAEQGRLIVARGRALFKWYRAHLWLHNVISGAVLVALFAADAFTLLRLPSLFLHTGSNSVTATLLAALTTAAIHSWLIYSLVVYSIHEGAAHNEIFVGTGVLADAGRFIARNACRIGGSDPEYYAPCHMGHHSKFGTAHDPEFLNFVLPHRLWMSLLPFAVFINFTDFVAHRPPTYTRSRVISGVLSLVYHGIYGWFMAARFGPAVPLLILVLLPHISFYLDRFRQFTEHNLMPLDSFTGARNLGVGFWGLLIGGGPWGQPCHLAHHMVPSVPWYQQILLHRYIKRLLTERQRDQFLIAPVVGFPMLLLHIVRDANGFARRSVQLPRPAAELDARGGPSS